MAKVVPIQTPGQRVIKGLQEALAVAKGETQPGRVSVIPIIGDRGQRSRPGRVPRAVRRALSASGRGL